ALLGDVVECIAGFKPLLPFVAARPITGCFEVVLPVGSHVKVILLANETIGGFVSDTRIGGAVETAGEIGLHRRRSRNTVKPVDNEDGFLLTVPANPDDG